MCDTSVSQGSRGTQCSSQLARALQQQQQQQQQQQEQQQKQQQQQYLHQQASSDVSIGLLTANTNVIMDTLLSIHSELKVISDFTSNLKTISGDTRQILKKIYNSK